MSGPKVSSYELARIQQERLRRQREEQERRERERREKEREQRRIEALRLKFTDYLNQIESCANDCMNFIQGIDHGRYDVSDFRVFLSDVSTLKQKFGNFIDVCGHGAQKEAVCDEALRSLLERSKKIKTMMSALHQTRLKDQREMATRMIQEYHMRQQNINNQHNSDLTKKADSIYNEMLIKLSELSTDFDAQDQIEAAKSFLMNCKNSYASHPERLYDELHKFQIGTLQHLVETIKQAKFRTKIRERYESLCSVAQVTPMKYDDAYAITIEHACTELENALDEHRNKAYARQAIRECMEELGYHLVGERSNQEQNPTLQYLYHITGTENVLRVTCTDGGQTIIEIGKGDKMNRSAEPREIGDLVASMESFCADGFPAILKKLREKGVYLTEESWLPPIAECAQIIDMTPFLQEESNYSLQSVYDQIVTKELMAAQME